MEEFVEGCDLLRLKFPREDFERSFRFLDRNESGYIEYEEFCDLIENQTSMIKVPST
jgi:Ca2+-binding EF-hand superfamily protein